MQLSETDACGGRAVAAHWLTIPVHLAHSGVVVVTVVFVALMAWLVLSLLWPDLWGEVIPQAFRNWLKRQI